MRSLRKASEFAATQGPDGAWRVFTEPRILENAVVACSLTGVEGAQAARARAVRWLAGAAVQRHDRFAEAADRWLAAVATTGPGAAFTDLGASDGPRARRTLYLEVPRGNLKGTAVSGIRRRQGQGSGAARVDQAELVFGC